MMFVHWKQYIISAGKWEADFSFIRTFGGFSKTVNGFMIGFDQMDQ